ncbi:Gfo/Idh/MocA family protein [Ideonella sp. BN130291]|uniref:Gfo/Idh/MocA family protein n=1 Tax=Ideonella sp. BN130291 TaxID=3112940 RepID=UPI002E25FE72|nr:Gfo/Idh/MocA family oxidoreductase [Ideonella sp. BN130291]
MVHDSIGWGLLGTGGICSAMAQALAHVPGARLAAVGSRGLERAQAFATAHAGAHADVAVHGSYQALVDDPAVQVVYVGTPHPDHAASALLALRAGKAVLCEKPFTLNAAQAQAVVAEARARRLFLMEAMWTRFVPAVAEVARLVRSGAIGEPLSVQADFGFDASAFAPGHRVLDPQLGGGALLDVGIYPLALASFLMGPISAVQAQAQLAPTGVDVHTTFSLQHRSGALSQGLCSLRSTTPWRALVLGSAGRIELHTPFFHAERFLLVRHGDAQQEHHLPHTGNGYAHQVEEVQRCLRAGLTESPVMPLDETLALMGWMDEMRAQIGLRYPGE